MEPLVAVSLAANIIQVLDFSKKIVSQSKDPRQVAGDSASYKLLTNYSTTLSEIRSAFSNDQARASETALSTLAQECELLTAELERLLIKIEEPGNGGSLRTRWKRTFHQKDFDQLAQRIEQLRSQVHLIVTTLLL
jgi:peptidoglycan hydrolase CwlO-like protein